MPNYITITAILLTFCIALLIKFYLNHKRKKHQQLQQQKEIQQQQIIYKKRLALLKKSYAKLHNCKTSKVSITNLIHYINQNSTYFNDIDSIINNINNNTITKMQFDHINNNFNWNIALNQLDSIASQKKN